MEKASEGRQNPSEPKNSEGSHLPIPPILLPDPSSLSHQPALHENHLSRLVAILRRLRGTRKRPSLDDSSDRLPAAPRKHAREGVRGPSNSRYQPRNVAISGLQEFNAVWCHHDPKMYFRDGNPEGSSSPDRRNIPADLEDCIVRKNDGFSEKCLLGLLTLGGMIKEEGDDEWW
ncbi:hypothetical protein TWF102_011742 [Orbilia oligospora]|uniref:Uncharacterized protein n=1 Tax=Orbilia oligospora TaxID=2813651 RepID=A0A7C8J4E3_ORBOL|nr:hypothetical protein TWF102_011742 [Orbilia oligospora]KAF3104585.1 hypothetical protein TWF103_006905 [Orbilia oligospora]